MVRFLDATLPFRSLFLSAGLLVMGCISISSFQIILGCLFNLFYIVLLDTLSFLIHLSQFYLGYDVTLFCKRRRLLWLTRWGRFF